MSKHHQETAPFVERLIFNNRIAVLLIFALLTAFFGYQAAQVKPDTSFEKMIPLKHPYVVNMIEHENDLPNLGNSIRIAVEIEDGDIFSAEYMDMLKRINDEVFFLPGVDRSNLRSLWTPNVRWTEVTEYGFDGGPVANRPSYSSEEDLDELRANVLKSGEIGRLVGNNFKSTIIDVPLQEAYPNPDNQSELIQLDYGDFSRQLEEKIRQHFEAENPNIKVHIVGFAKKVGDLIEGIIKVVMFFGAALLITFVLLMMFTRCIKSSLTTLACSVIAVVWQLGLLRTLGFGLDPYSILVPFLVFAIGISHGVQIINGMAIEYPTSQGSYDAARRAFRSLYIPGIVALISDAVGFVTLLLIEIEVIRELGIAASIGVGVIILTNLMLLPILMSYIGLSKSAVERNRDRASRPQKLWLAVAKFAHPSVAPISVLLAILAFAFGIYHGKNVAIGDLDPGAPELRADSRYNLDNKFIIDNYSTSSDILVVMVKTPDEMCSAHSTMEAIDDLEWKMNNLDGVQSAVSLVTVAKQVIMGNNEGNLKWQGLSRNQDNLNNAISRAPSGMFNAACSLAPVMIFLDDHKAATLTRATSAVEEFAAEYNTDTMEFKLAAGNAGIEAATNVVIEASQTKMLLTVYAVVIFMCLVTFRSIRAVLCIIIPLALTSVLANALMAFLGIGVKVATLPVIALGVGIGVDYGIYIYSRLESYLRQGLPLQEAYYETLKTTGKAVTFTGFTLAIGVATWIFSAIKFQADMGILLTFMFLWNMFGALWLLPALARFLIRPDKLRK
ncbi:MAG TPA: RND family transporter [Pseudomonas sabulinigri]|uniref:SSD domain-containing protein n=1 Tax=marine sediment metagenome TaxID=412755 RepID=A0A0F9VVX4_9ZZZZ|nr:RND family transporter [Halopseudomonas sabulinigri]HEC50920.1 RND family transporter [Halopseudomonas sabulinigri]|tara:strand:+ start:36847 stop:39198 length:2352 start_codon:yes stop_codon:yes gene_type:complete